jgi:hypothetical protein
MGVGATEALGGSCQDRFDHAFGISETSLFQQARCARTHP